MSQVERENQAVLALVQAMVGAISGNFRRVSLAIVDDATQLQFVLATEAEEDREEIADVAFLFESLHGHQVNVVVDICELLGVIVELRKNYSSRPVVMQSRHQFRYVSRKIAPR